MLDKEIAFHYLGILNSYQLWKQLQHYSKIKEISQN